MQFVRILVICVLMELITMRTAPSTVLIPIVLVLLGVKQKHVMTPLIMTVMVTRIVMIRIVLGSEVVPKIVLMVSIMMLMEMLTVMTRIV